MGKKLNQEDVSDLVEAFRILRDMRDETPFMESDETAEDTDSYQLH